MTENDTIEISGLSWKMSELQQFFKTVESCDTGIDGCDCRKLLMQKRAIQLEADRRRILDEATRQEQYNKDIENKDAL